MRCVILAGGLGTRIREESEFKPKPMIMVGGRPIIWHIMRNYASFGYKSFVVCAGYKGEVLKDYFLTFSSKVSDFSLTLGSQESIVFHDELNEKDWHVTVSDTGENTMTGGRLFKVRKFIDDDVFLCTYGDGLADVDISKLVEFHRSHGKVATVTAIRPISRFGVLEINSGNQVQQFREKPQADGWVNAGFFVFNKSIFEYLSEDAVLENEPMIALARENQLMAFKHEGFWQPMDTYREFKLLNELWENGEAPWKAW